ncbi:hypothetical protein GDO81_016212 [Engystomops pustulosus]|uniref:Uncharacterized protein n=1 Tax=Engystomops pustulosus TaxID=76066 RepID=A0AAV7AWE3_ENGPU|nr:hypothetical protein GDO81_016212 [Engystomops pustulosus]
MASPITFPSDAARTHQSIPNIPKHHAASAFTFHWKYWAASRVCHYDDSGVNNRVPVSSLQQIHNYLARTLNYNTESLSQSTACKGISLQYMDLLH